MSNDAKDLVLHVCATCRDPAKGAPPCDRAQQLLAAGKLWGKQQGRTVKLVRATCLSGCAVGLMAMIESEDGMVRLHNVQTTAQWRALLAQADALLAGTATAEATQSVLSRTDWSMWQDEGSAPEN